MPTVMTTGFDPGCDAVATNPTIGTLRTKAGNYQVALDGDRHQIKINLDHPISLPSTVLALRGIDIGASDGEMHLQSSIDNIYPQGFTVHLSSHGRTCLYGSTFDYLVVDGTSHLLQTGSVDSHSLRTTKYGSDVVSRVAFRYPYTAPPRVFLALAGLGIGGSQCTAWEIRTFATHVDSQGFTIHIEKRKDVEEVEAGRAIGNAQVHWIAYREGGLPGLAMCSGEVRFGGGDMRSTVEVKGVSRTVVYAGGVTFPRRFERPPRVLLGLAGFDSGRGQNLRLSLEVEGVTEEKMEWKAVTWWDTQLNGAALTYLAIETP